MDQAIRLRATGRPNEFAGRLGLSQSSMYNYLDMLKAMGGPIAYCKKAESFVYKTPVRLDIGYKEDVK